MTDDYAMVITTTETEDDAATLARKVVEARLAACVQIVPIRSVFIWDGETNDTPEVLMLMKTRDGVYDELEAFVKENHPYDVPEIIRTPVDRGYTPYLQWVSKNTSRGADSGT